MPDTLYYVHDPMCSWCWGFQPTWKELKENLSTRIASQMVLGGLAPDTNEPMPEPLRQMIQNTWHRIESSIPGTRFNYNFWTKNTPRRATYPACRAVLATINQQPALEVAMVEAIQHAYYLEARNPSINSVLIELANQIGCDTTQFAKDLDSDPIHHALAQQIQLGQSLGAQGFPSLFLKTGAMARPCQIPIDFHNTKAMFDRIEQARAA